jgi:acyl dehydratase
VSASATSRCEDVDDRRLVAFAAAIHDTSPAHFDLDRPGGVVAHPLFPVCLEWPLVEHGQPGLGMTDDEAHGGIHVMHAVTWHRPLRPGRCVTTVRLEALEPRSIGAYALTRFETTTEHGVPIVSTRQGVIYLGVDAHGGRAPAARAPVAADAVVRGAALVDVGEFHVLPEDPVVYTECAQIWNPIHTDPRVARAKGLDNPIMHGTATLARAVSVLVARHGGDDPFPVAHVSCRFTASVPAGETVRVRAALRDARHLDFEACLASGERVLAGGRVVLRTPTSPVAQTSRTSFPVARP